MAANKKNSNASGRSSGIHTFTMPYQQVRKNIRKAEKFPGKIKKDVGAFNAVKAVATTQEQKRQLNILMDRADKCLFLNPKPPVEWMKKFNQEYKEEMRQFRTSLALVRKKRK